MIMRYAKKRDAVAPVLATLLMIAVAVAMSVIIFMWSQGFLSNTSGATGSQQNVQNQAAQSSIAIESATFVDSTSAQPTITVIVRNVGSVPVTLGSISIIGTSSNAKFTGSLIATVTGGNIPSVQASDSSTWTATPNTGVTLNTIPKGSAVTITLQSTAAGSSTSLTSGDVLNVKITTNVGTFASAQYTAL